MHPNRAFAWTDAAAMRAFIAETAFAHLFLATADGPLVAHAPVIVTDAGDLRFHLALGNRLTRHLDGSVLLASIAGADFYVSPDWYGREDQVPTWDYLAVEASGPVRRLDEAGLLDQIERLSFAHEQRLAPKKPWHHSKMDPVILGRMVRGIAGFEMQVTSLNGTIKLSQNKPASDLAGVVAALAALGRHREADLVAQANPGKC
jgi:transcriptional regulator